MPTGGSLFSAKTPSVFFLKKTASEKEAVFPVRFSNRLFTHHMEIICKVS